MKAVLQILGGSLAGLEKGLPKFEQVSWLPGGAQLFSRPVRYQPEDSVLKCSQCYTSHGMGLYKIDDPHELVLKVVYLVLR